MKIEIREQHLFDVDNLKNFLEAQAELLSDGLSDEFSLTAVIQFKQGQSNPTFLLEGTAGSVNKKYVLRKKPSGKLLPGAHLIDREYWAIRSLHSVNFPVPKPYFYCQDSTIIGTEFFVMEFVEGRIYADNLLLSPSNSLAQAKPLTAQDRREMIFHFIETLAKLHTIKYQDIGLDNFGSSSNYYQRQIATWTRNYKMAETDKIEAMDRLIEWLPKNIPSNNSASIVHGDYKIDNIIFHPTENRVIAVLDWELSTIGHPLADLAYCNMHYYLDNIEPFFKKPKDAVAIGVPSDKELLDFYCKITSRKSIEKWHFYVGFAVFRLAAILQGVLKRSIQGNASASNAKQVGALGSVLAEQGWKFVAQKEHLHYAKPNEGGISFEPSPRVKELKQRLESFMQKYVYPAEKSVHEQIMVNKWKIPPQIEELKQKAKQEGLWNLFMPEPIFGAPGLSNVEYAPLAELMGSSLIAPEIFNCNAPDTGNMEVLLKFGTEEQKEKYLKPLANGEIRSCFAMTEPAVASSDATNISCSITKTVDGKHYIIHGRKWWITGAGDPRCKFAIVMGKTDPLTKNMYKQQSMIIVPLDTPGVKIVRPLSSYGFDDAPSGHMELLFDQVKVPVSNVILGEGRGFEIAQQRLGPGRIHHMMRLIGLAERSLTKMCERITERRTFGKKLADHGVVKSYLAQSRIDIEMARLLVMKCAYMIDKHGNREARAEIAMIKAQVPKMIANVVDRVIQIHGAGGFSNDDFGLAQAWVGARTLRMADGPDEVHMETVAKAELEKFAKKKASADPLEQEYLLAQQSMSKIPNLSEQDILLLYGIFKQATAGDAKEAAPSKTDVKAYAKFMSWKQNQGLDAKQAKLKYVNTVKQLMQRSKL